MSFTFAPLGRRMRRKRRDVPERSNGPLKLKQEKMRLKRAAEGDSRRNRKRKTLNGTPV